MGNPPGQLPLHYEYAYPHTLQQYILLNRLVATMLDQQKTAVSYEANRTRAYSEGAWYTYCIELFKSQILVQLLIRLQGHYIDLEQFWLLI